MGSRAVTELLSPLRILLGGKAIKAIAEFPSPFIRCVAADLVLALPIEICIHYLVTFRVGGSLCSACHPLLSVTSIPAPQFVFVLVICLHSSGKASKLFVGKEFGRPFWMWFQHTERCLWVRIEFGEKLVWFDTYYGYALKHNM